MAKIEQPNHRIMCDNCTDYAKATLDGRNLCAGCLLSELMSAQNAELFDKLVPLKSEEDNEHARA